MHQKYKDILQETEQHLQNEIERIRSIERDNNNNINNKNKPSRGRAGTDFALASVENEENSYESDDDQTTLISKILPTSEKSINRQDDETNT